MMKRADSKDFGVLRKKVPARPLSTLTNVVNVFHKRPVIPSEPRLFMKIYVPRENCRHSNNTNKYISI